MNRGYGQLIGHVLDAVELLKLPGIRARLLNMDAPLSRLFYSRSIDGEHHLYHVLPHEGQLVYLGTTANGHGYSYYVILTPTEALYLKAYHVSGNHYVRSINESEVPAEYLARLAAELPPYVIAQWQEQQHEY